MTCYAVAHSKHKQKLPVKKWRKERQWLDSLLHFIGVDGNIISL